MLAIRLSPPEKRGRCVGYHRRPCDKRRSKHAQVSAQTRNLIRHMQWPTLLPHRLIDSSLRTSEWTEIAIVKLAGRQPRSKFGGVQAQPWHRTLEGAKGGVMRSSGVFM